ncbi:MAG: RNA polymerase subunit sigma-70, partial [Cohnella sp.]|nr:RNA polymerase subunit sigma-70 [Cohnella sp.]
NYRTKAFFRKMVLVDRIHSLETVPSAEAAFFAERYIDEIWHHVMQLSIKHREVLLLHIRYDLGIDEIASLLKVSAGTVKSRLHRAKNKLTRALKGEVHHE